MSTITTILDVKYQNNYYKTLVQSKDISTIKHLFTGFEVNSSLNQSSRETNPRACVKWIESCLVLNKTIIPLTAIESVYIRNVYNFYYINECLWGNMAESVAEY